MPLVSFDGLESRSGVSVVRNGKLANGTGNGKKVCCWDQSCRGNA